MSTYVNPTPTAVPTPPPAGQETPNLDDVTVCLVLDFHRWGVRRKVDAHQVETDADRALLAVSKRILDSPEYDAIVQHDGKTRAWVEARALPSLLKKGIWRLPVALVEETDVYLTTRAAERSRLVDELRAAYPIRLQETQARLSSLADGDLPTADEVAGKFSIAWKYISYGTPTTLQRLAPALFARERQKAAVQWQEATEEIRTVLRESMAELVTHLAERLSGTREDGRPKIFRDTAVTNLTEFLDLFQARNVTDDSELAALVARAHDLLYDVHPQRLRNNDALRGAVAQSMSQIKATLDTMLMDRPRRHIALDEA